MAQESVSRGEFVGMTSTIKSGMALSSKVAAMILFFSCFFLNERKSFAPFNRLRSL
jgi:hypothetical protein